MYAIVVLPSQAIDTSTPAGKALSQMLGVFAEFERALIRERVNAGLARARQKGTRSGRAIGQPPAATYGLAAAQAALAGGGASIRQAAEKAGLSVGKVAEIKNAMDWLERRAGQSST
jgi:DNA invertase Pin-like site-specific DNA recombinase